MSSYQHNRLQRGTLISLTVQQLQNQKLQHVHLVWRVVSFFYYWATDFWRFLKICSKNTFSIKMRTVFLVFKSNMKPISYFTWIWIGGILHFRTVVLTFVSLWWKRYHMTFRWWYKLNSPHFRLNVRLHCDKLSCALWIKSDFCIQIDIETTLWAQLRWMISISSIVELYSWFWRLNTAPVSIYCQTKSQM